MTQELARQACRTALVASFVLAGAGMSSHRFGWAVVGLALGMVAGVMYDASRESV